MDLSSSLFILGTWAAWTPDKARALNRSTEQAMRVQLMTNPMKSCSYLDATLPIKQFETFNNEYVNVANISLGI